MVYANKNTAVTKSVKLNSLNRAMRKQKGFTLIELGVVVAIGAVIAVAGILVVPKMLAENNAKKLNDALMMAIPKIQSAYQNRTNYTGLLTATVANNGWFSDPLIEKANGIPTGKIITPWANGTVEFAAIGTGAPQGQITISGAAPAVCNSVAANTVPNDMFLTATINGTSVKALNRDVDFAVTGVQCSSTNTNSIVLVFGRA